MKNPKTNNAIARISSIAVNPQDRSASGNFFRAAAISSSDSFIVAKPSIPSLETIGGNIVRPQSHPLYRSHLGTGE